MRLAAIALVLLIGAPLPGDGFAAASREQTDWYSRGVVRQQTIKVMTARQKRKQYLKRKKRKAHAMRHRTNTKSRSVTKS